MGARRQAEVGPLEHAAVSAWTRRRSKGSTVEDIDGDGRILQMRIPDPNGVWKAHPERAAAHDPPRSDRRPAARYYRIVPEGTVEDYDGFTLRVKKTKQGLDLNRNFPASTGGRSSSSSAPGPYPDVGAGSARGRRLHRRAIANITGGVAFHTWSGVLLRPFEHLPDDEMHAEDLWVYQAHGRQGHRAHRLSRHLGLPRVSLPPEAGDRRHVRLGLRAPRHVQLGGRDLVARCAKRASPSYKYIDWFRDHPPEDDLKLYPLERREARRHRAHSVEAVRPSAARPGRDRRLEPLPRVLAIRRRSSSSARSRASRSGSSGRRSPRRSSSSCTPAAKPLGGGHCTVRSSCRTRAGCRRYVSKRALERKVVRGVDRGDRAAGGRDAGRKASARDEHGQLEGKRVQAHRRVVLARLPRHRRPHEAEMGRARHGG